ncbi:MAG TPA: hypothetical protein VFK42_15325 [Acidimicrobiales bacterium]|nr:hypothetical protein [Acidimicrobiales bacterium]
MTVMQSIQSRVAPGRIQDAIGLAHETEKVCERYGAEVRLLAPSVAGEATGADLTLTIEVADLDAFATFADGAGNDPDVQSLQMRVMEANSPVTIVNQSLIVEIPRGKAPAPGRGNTVEVYVSKPLPGQYEKAVEDGIIACEVVEKAGAMNARIGTINFSGLGQGLTIASWEWADAKAFVKGFKVWETDKKAKALSERSLGANPSSTLFWSGLLQVIPL